MQEQSSVESAADMPGQSKEKKTENQQGAISKTGSYNNNPRRSFSRFSIALGFNSKKKDSEEGTSFMKKEKKMKKKEKSKSKVEDVEPLLVNDELVAGDERAARQMPSRGISLPEGNFPTIHKLKKQTSFSKLAGIARKVSLGKLRREKSIDKLHNAMTRSPVQFVSPTTSNEEINMDHADTGTDGSMESSGRVSGSHNLTSSQVLEPEYEVFIGSESLPSTPEIPETAVQDNLETSKKITDRFVDCSTEPNTPSQESMSSNETSPSFQQPDNNNKNVLATDKSKITPVDYPPQVHVQTSMNLELVSEDMLLQSGQSSVKQGGGESRSGSQNSGAQVSQLGASGDLRNTGKAFKREPSVQNPRDSRPVQFESYEKPQENVSALIEEGKPDSNVVSSEQLPVAVTDRRETREPVGVDIVDTPSDLGETQDESEEDSTKLQLSNEHYEEVTSIVYNVWMSQRKTEASVPPQLEDAAQNSTKKSRAKGKKLKIASPVTEEKKVEAQEEQESEEKTAESPPTSDSWSYGQMLDSVPGSSKSETFFTPKDSPTGMSSLDADSTSQDTLFFSPSSASETSEYSIKTSKLDSSLTNGEDVMAEARARLSQSLGIANATATQNQVGDKREHLYKILVIGELGTGKTSIIKRYVHQFFSQHYRATIGVDFALKVLNWDANTIIRLQLWDIAGQERFGNMTRVYYKEAVGAFIVFDVTRAATFDAVVKWKQDLDSKVQLPDGSAIPCVLLANKCDQQKEGLVNQPAKMDEYCKERGFSGWFETSAKENINIEEAARALVTKILQNDQLRTQPDSVKDGEKFNLDGNNLQDDKAKSKCSC